MKFLDCISHSYLIERHTISVEALNDAIGEKYISCEEGERKEVHQFENAWIGRFKSRRK